LPPCDRFPRLPGDGDAGHDGRLRVPLAGPPRFSKSLGKGRCMRWIAERIGRVHIRCSEVRLQLENLRKSRLRCLYSPQMAQRCRKPLPCAHMLVALGDRPLAKSDGLFELTCQQVREADVSQSHRKELEARVKL
jgi:hypothetical protein